MRFSEPRVVRFPFTRPPPDRSVFLRAKRAVGLGYLRFACLEISPPCSHRYASRAPPRRTPPGASKIARLCESALALTLQQRCRGRIGNRGLSTFHARQSPSCVPCSEAKRRDGVGAPSDPTGDAAIGTSSDHPTRAPVCCFGLRESWAPSHLPSRQYVSFSLNLRRPFQHSALLRIRPPPNLGYRTCA